MIALKMVISVNCLFSVELLLCKIAFWFVADAAVIFPMLFFFQANYSLLLSLVSGLLLIQNYLAFIY